MVLHGGLLAYSHLYTAVQNRPCLLVESHSLKTAKTRAWAHYDIMRGSINTILKDPEALRAGVRAADAATIVSAADRSAAPVFLAGEVDGATSRPLFYHSLKNSPFVSEITGATINHFTSEKDDFSIVIHDRIKTTAQAQMPLGYRFRPLGSRSPMSLLCMVWRWSGQPGRSNLSWTLGYPPPLSWLEVQSFVGFRWYYRLQNILNKGLMPKILSTKDLVDGWDVKEPRRCAQPVFVALPSRIRLRPYLPCQANLFQRGDLRDSGLDTRKWVNRQSAQQAPDTDGLRAGRRRRGRGRGG